MRLPRAYLVSHPDLAVSASGEVWVVAGGSLHVHHVAIVVHHSSRGWRQLQEWRLRDLPSAVGFPDTPDGLHGIRLGFDLYWPGRGPVKWSPIGCDGALYANAGATAMDGIPRTRDILFAGACQKTTHGRIQGAVLISRGR